MSDNEVVHVYHHDGDGPSVSAVAFVLFIALALIFTYWQWVLLFVVGVLLAWVCIAINRAFARRAAVEEEVKRRADQHLKWMAEGDPRGIYGEGWTDDGEEQRT